MDPKGIINPGIYILGPDVDILDPQVDILDPEIDILDTEVHNIGRGKSLTDILDVICRKEFAEPLAACIISVFESIHGILTNGFSCMNAQSPTEQTPTHMIFAPSPTP